MTYGARDLQLHMVEPSEVQLVRLFSRTNAEWDAPPPAFRDLRCDPPHGKKDDYALLYTGDNIPLVSMECNILSVDRSGVWSYDEAKTRSHYVARYTFTRPGIFIPLDENRSRLSIDRVPFVPGYAPWQEAAHELWQRFGDTVHGLSWWSMHRHQPGRVYAIWHHRKDAMRLERPTGPFDKLEEDAEWKALLLANPSFTKLSVSPTGPAAPSGGAATAPSTP